MMPWMNPLDGGRMEKKTGHSSIRSARFLFGIIQDRSEGDLYSGGEVESAVA